MPTKNSIPFSALGWRILHFIAAEKGCISIQEIVDKFFQGDNRFFKYPGANQMDIQGLLHQGYIELCDEVDHGGRPWIFFPNHRVRTTTKGIEILKKWPIEEVRKFYPI